MSAKQTLLQWLTDGDLERTLRGLMFIQQKWRAKSLGNQAFDSFFQLGRYNTLKSSLHKGTVSHADYSVELASIREATLAIVHWLPENQFIDGLEAVRPSESPRVGVTPSHPDTPPRWYKSPAFWMGAVAVLGLLIAALAYLNDLGIFPKKPEPPPLVQPAAQRPDTLLQQTTHGPQSPNVKTESGDVNIQYGDSDWEKAQKKPQNQRDTTRKR